jgi:hypothetical protein
MLKKAAKRMVLRVDSEEFASKLGLLSTTVSWYELMATGFARSVCVSQLESMIVLNEYTDAKIEV